MNTRTAPEGMWLTQSNLPEKKENTRIFVSKVSGYGDLDNLFTLWTDAQKTEWEAEHSETNEEAYD